MAWPVATGRIAAEAWLQEARKLAESSIGYRSDYGWPPAGWRCFLQSESIFQGVQVVGNILYLARLATRAVK